MDTNSLVKQALLEIKRLKREKEMPIAIIGTACRFPNGINSPEMFWESLINKKDCITAIPKERWDMDAYYSPNRAEPGKMYVREGGFVDNIDQFDLDLFKIPLREAKYMDPQQRLFLEVSWECLERSGIDPLSLKGTKTGVYLGICTHDYAMHSLYSQQMDKIDIYSFTGSAFSIASGRLSYMLGLEGPSMSIDTACSSSLVALHEACSSICNKKSEMAIVGGVNLMITPEHTIQFCKVNALSPSSRCKAFDASADGYVRSEGCGVILLKSLDKAIEDKNQILAVIRGVAINNDGVSNSLTAPNGLSQQKLISEALKSANVEPNQVLYVEAHGTGTPLGDPIEVNALGNVYCKDRKSPLWVGTVKTNIGHLEAAAGMAGLIKTVLAIKNKKIPPNLHFENPNPEIPWGDYDIRIPTKAEEWPEGKKIAGISAFGFSGTNAHVILEEPPIVMEKESGNVFPVLALSAQNEKALFTKVEQTCNYIMQKEAISLERVCYTSNVCRPHLPYRKAFLFSDVYQLKQVMSEFLDQPYHKKENLNKVVFFIPDEINIKESSIKFLYDRNKVFRDVFNTCLRELHMENLNDFLLKTHRQSRGFIAAFAVVSTLITIGVNPEGIIGDGKGWLAVFCTCEMFSLQQGLSLLNIYLEDDSKGSFLSKLESVSFKQPLYLLMNKDASRLDMSKITERSFWNATVNDVTLPENNKAWLLSIGEGTVDKLFWNPEENLSLFKVAAFFYEHGTDIRWELFFEKNQFVPEALPTTPLIRSRYWIDRPDLKVNTDSLTSGHGFYFHKLPLYNKDSWCFVFRISQAKNKFLKDHGFLGSIVLPATAYVEMMTYVGMDILGNYNFIIKNISYEQALKISSDQSTELHAYIEKQGNGRMQISLVSHNQLSGSDIQWIKHASATIEEGKNECFDDVDLDYIRRKSSRSLDVYSYYERLNNIGYLFGDLHQGINEIRTDGTLAFAKVVLPLALETESDKYFYHPALLDACSQVFLSFIPEDLPEDYIYITVGTEKFVPYQSAEGELYVAAQVTDKEANNLKGNIFIYNSKHEMVAAIIGYMTKKVRKSVLLQTSSKGSDCCYKAVWLPKAKRLTENVTGGVYILWADHSPFSLDLRNELQKQGNQCIMVYRSEAFKMVCEYEFELDPANTEHIVLFKKRLEHLNADGRLSGGIYLMNLDYSFSPLTQDIKEDVEAICKPLWNIAKELCRNKDSSIQNLTVITQNSCNIQFGDYWTNPVSTAVWGFIKVMNLEYPWIKCKAIDISEKGMQQCEIISQEILCQSKDKLIAFRDGQRYVQRLSRLVSDSEENQSIFNDAYALRLKAKGSIDYLEYEKVQRTEPADDEVEIEVIVSGFNFHDIIHVLNLMKEESDHFGLDCSGRIVRAGKKVLDLKVGDTVIAFAPGCFGRYVTTKSCYVIKKPENINAFEAATIPSVYMTAYHIINNILSLEKGRSILVHAASGGLGIALINLAQNIGLTVYATASKNKWFLLKQMGVEHIFDSRSTGYAEQILALTGKKGIDAVVNSFTGEHIAKGFSVLKSGGYFVEVGKREKLTGEQVLKYRKDVMYSTVSLFDVIRDEPQKAKEMLTQLAGLLETGRIKPIPYQVTSKTKIKDAFRFIQKGKHIGKMLVDFSEKKELKDKRTVIIAGGANGIGWEIAKYWAGNFDDSLVLLGRSPETREISEKLKAVGKKGKDIAYYSVDIGDSKALGRVLDEVNVKFPPLKGIIHSAGVISDNLIKDESWENIEKVLNPKIFGVWNLHNLTLAKELDFFVLFSSVTAVLGSIGVSGYVTGNSFMEGFAQYRRQLGLPCLCLNWGPWQEAGMLTRLNSVAREIWTQNGFKTLLSDEGVAIFDDIKGLNDNVSIMPVDWNKWLKQYPTGKVPDLISDFTVRDNSEKNNHTVEAVKQEIAAKSSTPDTWEKVLEDIQNIFKRVLQRNVLEDEFEKLSFQEIGLDSLMSVEFRNLLNERFKTDFAISLLYSYPDIKSLHKHICDEVLGISLVNTEDKPAENRIREKKPDGVDAIQQKNESKDLSINDLRKLLDEKLDMYSNK